MRLFYQGKSRSINVILLMGSILILGNPAQAKGNTYCSWSNNLNLSDTAGNSSNRLGYAGDSTDKENTNYTKALSTLTAGCSQQQKVCFGQVTCAGSYENSNVKKKNSNNKFDFYTYVGCLVAKNTKCPSAHDCIKQTGELTDIFDRDGYGYFEDTNGAYKPGTGKDKTVVQ